MPSQLAAAKTVFISNASDENESDTIKGYDRIYAAIQKLNRFTIVFTPNDADLVLEFGQIDGKYSKSNGDKEVEFRQRLRIIDPHTHILLWSATVPNTGRLTERDTNNEAAINRLANYLQKITTQTSRTAK